MFHGIAPAWRGVLIVLAATAQVLAMSAGAPAVASPAEGLRPFTSDPPPRLALDRLGGGRVATDALRGRVILVHFFATWCEPCRPELASLNRLHEETGARGLDILAVSVAEVEPRLVRFFAEAPVSFPVVLDRDRGAIRAWAIDALPSTIVLDRAGRPRLAVRGDLDWQRPDVRATLEELLAENGRSDDKPGGNEPT